MKKFTFLILLLCTSFLVINSSLAQISTISPDPAFDKSKSFDATFDKRIKAKEHNGALTFNHAKHVVLENNLRKIFTVEIDF